eukprot:jgi/Orpsp1_1/1176479/evm.model.c7180000057791.1
MNCIWLFTFLLLSVIGNVYGRIVSFSVIAFGGQATVSFGGFSYVMNLVDSYSNVHTVSAECPEEAF